MNPLYEGDTNKESEPEKETSSTAAEKETAPTETATSSSQVAETSLRMESTTNLIKMEEELMRKWTKTNIRQLKKRAILYVIAIILFIVSIFTHGITNFDEIVLESLTTVGNYTIEQTSVSSDMFFNLF